MYGGDTLRGLPFPTAPAHRITPPALDPQSTVQPHIAPQRRHSAVPFCRFPTIRSRFVRAAPVWRSFVQTLPARLFPGSALSMTRPMKNNMEKPGLFPGKRHTIFLYRSGLDEGSIIGYVDFRFSSGQSPAGAAFPRRAGAGGAARTAFRRLPCVQRHGRPGAAGGQHSGDQRAAVPLRPAAARHQGYERRISKCCSYFSFCSPSREV